MSGLRYDFDFLCHRFIAHHGAVSARDVALVFEDRRITWSEVDALTNRVAHLLLSLGLGRGDKVCMGMSNSIEMFITFWGVVKAGCVVVPYNPLLDDASVARLIDNSEGVLLFLDPSTIEQGERIQGDLDRISPERIFAFGNAAPWRSAEGELLSQPACDPGVHIGPLDPMTLIYTSGTTGLPKGIYHNHGARLKYALGFGVATGITRHSVTVAATPLYAAGTWITMFPAIFTGAKIVIIKRFAPRDLLETIERERGSHMFLVPTQSIALLDCPDIATRDLTSLKMIVTSGQPLPEATRRELTAALPETRICEVYGMAEGFSTFIAPEERTSGKPGLVGKPTFMEDIRIIDDGGTELPAGEQGEIVAYGPGMMLGYYNAPETTEAATWIAPDGRAFMRSGDVGYIDVEGWLYTTGRIKDMIKSGGLNIFAQDLEEVFLAHPDVREAVVVAIPHEKWVETPLLLVIRREGATVTEEELQAWGNERLARYQRVARVEFRDDFPRALYGKVRRAALRDPYWPAAAR